MGEVFPTSASVRSDVRKQLEMANENYNHLANVSNVQVKTIDELRQRIARAIAKARKYMHPGTNAGTHGVLSEIVEILEGSNTKGE